MSIEKLLGDLIDALKENTAAIMAGVNAKTEVTLAAAKLVDKAKTTKAPAKEEDDEKPARRSAAKEEDDEPEFTLADVKKGYGSCLLYTSPSPRD